MEVDVPVVLGCSYGLAVSPGESIETKASPNGKEMEIRTGLLRFVEDNDELAIAIAHQIAHSAIESDLSQEEPMVDKIGLAIAGAAGFDVTKAPAYWDRWAAVQFCKIPIDPGKRAPSHGEMSQRALAIRWAAGLEKRAQPTYPSTPARTDPSPPGRNPPE